MTTIKVAMFSPLEAITGISKYSVTLAKALQEEGINVTLIAGPITNTPRRNVDNITSKSSCEIRVQDIADNYDIAHFQFGNSHLHHYQVHLVRKLREKGMKIVTTFHDGRYNYAVKHACFRCLSSLFKNRLRTFTLDHILPSSFSVLHIISPLTLSLERFIVQEFYHSSDRVIIHSTFLRDTLGRINEDEHKICVIKHIGYLHEFKKTTDSKAEDKLILVIPGYLSWEKGQDIILRALANLSMLEYSAVFVGGDTRGAKYLRKLQTLCQELGISRNVMFTGFQDEETFLTYLNKADIALIPRSEPYGEISGALIHALSASKPVIVANNASFREYVMESFGRFCKPKSVLSWQEAIRELAIDKNKRAEMSKAASEYASNNLDKKIIAQQHIRLYRTLLKD